jgi:hypothetical protein
MNYTNKSSNEPLYHHYSPLNIITTTLHTLPLLSPVFTSPHHYHHSPHTSINDRQVPQTCHHRTPHLFLDPGPDSPSFISEKKGGSCMAPSVGCIARVVRWRGPTAQLPAWQCEA